MGEGWVHTGIEPGPEEASLLETEKREERVEVQIDDLPPARDVEIVQIDPTAKYAVILSPPVPERQLAALVKQLKDWLASDEQIFVLAGGITLMKVDQSGGG